MIRPAAALAALVAASVLAVAVARAEPAVAVRAIELKQSPAADARTVGTVASGATVDIVKREGAWVQVKAGATTGWAKLFDLKPPAAASKGGGSSIAQTLGLAAGTRSATVTTGVRGLDADMLKAASPNPQEFAAFEKGRVSKGDAQAFARAGNLQTRSVPDPGSGK